MAERPILTDDMLRVLTEQSLVFMATVNPDGTPNLSPKGTVRHWRGDQLMFADLRSPGTMRNLASNPAVDLNVVDPINRKGYRFKGSGRVLREGAEYETIMALYRETTERADERIRAVVVIDVAEAFPLTSPAYDLGRSEAEVTASWITRWRTLYRF
ncbi:MAG: pyridoxamine 5'-phosphate oxidase family protein [bacterium]